MVAVGGGSAGVARTEVELTWDRARTGAVPVTLRFSCRRREHNAHNEKIAEYIQ
jgi:hypothetical protein